MEAGLASAQALGLAAPSVVALRTVPFAPVCGRLAWSPPANSPGRLATAREGQRSSSAFIHPTPNVLPLVSSFEKEIEAHSPRKKVRPRGENKPYQDNLWMS